MFQIWWQFTATADASSMNESSWFSGEGKREYFFSKDCLWSEYFSEPCSEVKHLQKHTATCAIQTPLCRYCFQCHSNTASVQLIIFTQHFSGTHNADTETSRWPIGASVSNESQITFLILYFPCLIVMSNLSGSTSELRKQFRNLVQFPSIWYMSCK